MHRKPVFLLLMLLSTFTVGAQNITVSGKVTGKENQPLVGVTIKLDSLNRGTSSDQSGNYILRLPSGDYTIIFSAIGYESQKVSFQAVADTVINVNLADRVEELETIEVADEASIRDEIVSSQKIDAKSAKSLPSTFGDFNKVLVTLPGVSSNNELSSAYSVRGGNFDENLVYVNDIPVYRPFLANAGRQEGLSFVNPDMVQDIEFYAGGWEPKYGDKLSSSLNIEYKEPDSLEAGVTVGLLGWTAYTGGATDRMSYLIGARHRDSRYLLNTLEVEGQYFPTYTDVQSLFTFDLTRKNSDYINKTKLNWLLAYGRNRYLTEPVSQSTDFGSVQQNFRLQTAFQGREILSYDTYQTGFRLTHRFNDRLRSHLIGSALMTSEKEQYDVEGAYRLCDVNNDPNTSSFDECVIVRGVGTNYEYGRNALNAKIFTAENRYEYLLNLNHVLEAGIGVTFQSIEDELNEYSFIDSADYVSDFESTFNQLQLDSRQVYGYVQSTFLWQDSIHAVSAGIRANHFNLNNQLMISPRIAYRWAPKWESLTTFKLSAGVYQQPAFYRELRDNDGNLVTNVDAQRSIHFIAGMTRLFHMWGRPFLFTTDVYHKELTNIYPYDIDNVRLRYYPQLMASGFARGFDFRIHGEFVKGTQSWFSVGFLQTQEDIEGDDQGLLRRPTDQRINLAAYFEDHMPNDPSLRVYLNLVFGSGYPFGPPNRPDLRNAFSGDEYYRADIGLSKSFNVDINNMFSKLWLRLEVLNAFAADNTLSYTWIEDVNGAQFAIPNSLSARFLNIKLTAEL